MKKLTIFLLLLAGVTAGNAFAQTTTTHEEHTTLKKKGKSKVTTQSKDSLTRDSAPILNDNGTTSTTGTIDGRSSTGRTGDDPVPSYTVKKRKRTIKTEGAVTDTLKKP